MNPFQKARAAIHTSVASRQRIGPRVAVLALACGLASSALADPIQLPPNVIRVEIEDEDISTDKGQWSSSTRFLGGVGQEPMIDMTASLFVNPDSGLELINPGYGVGKSISFHHMILPDVSCPDELRNVAVPYAFQIRISGTVAGLGSIGAAATVNGMGHSAGEYAPGAINYSGVQRGTALPGTVLVAYLAGAIQLKHSYYMTEPSEGQLIVDPYIYIDPTWEHAGYFHVFQADDLLSTNPAEFIHPVTRDWMLIPEPSSTLLLGIGLSGVCLWRKRRA